MAGRPRLTRLGYTLLLAAVAFAASGLLVYCVVRIAEGGH